MFLATTALSEFWDPSAPILFLGPWCTLYDKRDEWAHLDYRFLPNPWDDRERFWQAALYCQDIYDHLIVEIGTFLNKIHGVSFDERYWHILLGPWLYGFIDIFYDHYVHIKEAFNIPNIKTWLLDEKYYSAPWDVNEFISLVEDDLYNLQLYSQIIRNEGNSFLCKRPAILTIDLQKEEIKTKKVLFKKIIKDMVNKLLNKIYYKNNIVLLTKEFKLLLTPGFNVGYINKKFPQRYHCRACPGNPIRQNLAKVLTAEDPFIKILVDALSANFPVLYLEGYKSCRKWVIDQYKQKDFPRVLIDVGTLWENEFGKFLAGEVSARGGEIISFQHGAGYGSSRILRVERYERHVADKFYSWGWASQEDDPKLANLPSPKLPVKKRKPTTSSPHAMILLVGTGLRRYFFRFESLPVGSNCVKYIQATISFLKEVELSKRKNLVYRGYMKEFGWSIPDKLKEHFPHLAIDNHFYSFRHQLRRSRLIIFDHPGTSFLEAMAANVPLILFFEPSFWEIRTAAQPYFDMLRQAEILHDSPRSAAHQVNRVYDDIDEWWFSTPRQEIRNQFKDHFALASVDWSRQWIKAIKRGLGKINK